MKRNGACMCGSSHGGSGADGSGMSCGPRKPRRKVNGNASPGIEMNSPSPIWNAATCERSDYARRGAVGGNRRGGRAVRVVAGALGEHAERGAEHEQLVL